ncbi:acyltransferase family protein [Ichthyenterobacterium magnum]|uniref:Peptidoglycan/LPS O-acetylase OafA/YrhL n=1 Tax=Ichthyenterobacterium magnum TaxID=1230530 RepID=A0A420DGF3_9FLAO|nr:acyltransferase [Ichthyenterobacterium magnum]RKE92172.1 peptidoglycan/LPS O-acetylase OafA/YrhL [Ichthyenterobacterium magnum]
MTTKLSRLFGLDLLRAIAISLVVISHCTFLLFPNTTSIVLDVIRLFGAVGVDLFFVLSGYLIGGILLKQIASNKTKFKDLFVFWKRRWLRTLPNYFLVLILNVLLLSALGKGLVSDIWLYVPFLQNFVTQHPDFFTEAWSLSIEEYAYLILPFLMYCSFTVFKKVKPKKLFLIVTLVTIVVLFGLKLYYGLTTDVTSYKTWSLTFRKVVVYRLDSIYYGFLLIYVSKQFPNWVAKCKTYLLLLGIALFGLLHIAIFWFKIMPETHLMFYTLFYLQVLILSLGLMFPYFSSLNYKGIWQPLVYFISTRSYTIYLVNYSLVLLTFQHFFEIEQFSVFQKCFALIGYLITTLLISELIYRWFEQPILKFRDKKYSR